MGAKDNFDNSVLPNTFLIGAQKCATSSLYSWLAQHPDVCAPMSVKDRGFFTQDEFYNQGFNYLSDYYKNEFNNEKIILQGSVHYIYFEKALSRIHQFNPNSKFILVLRNPIDRALSSYKYARKFYYETYNIEKAFELEPERLKSNDYQTLSELTYKSHGLYFKQIQAFLKYFKRNQLKILFYEDISETPEVIVSEIFHFLNIDSSFAPQFNVLNITGGVKSKTLQKILFKDNKVKKWIVDNIIKKLISKEIKAKIRWKLIEANTKKSSKTDNIVEYDESFILSLHEYFRDDINNLEIFLKKDLTNWKTYKNT